MIWHSNGRLYAPFNGSANGNTPADPAPGGAPQLNDLPPCHDYFTQIVAGRLSTSVVATGFYNPLAIAIDQATGRVYVGEYGRDPDGAGGLLTLLTPQP